MTKKKRIPSASPGKAEIECIENDDFTLCAALYHDAIHFYSAAKDSNDLYSSDRYKRASILAIFSFFEAQLNQIAFAHAEAHKDTLPEFELDILEEKETKLNSDGTIQRNNKFYSTEARFRFLTYFLSGKSFDCSGKLWADFRQAQEIRNRWVHPKPPFNTWGLKLDEVKLAIVSIRAVLVELSDMMETEPPLWLVKLEKALANVESTT